VFVGEPTGARPNHYGDSRKIQLPNSGLTVRTSTLYWQYSGPKDDRPWLVPHIPTELSSEDYRLGRDPALNLILSLDDGNAGDGPEGSWTGHLLEYNIVLNLRLVDDEWLATIDFPDEDAIGLPLGNVAWDVPSLRFEFQNGDSAILFEGTLQHDVVIGSVSVQGQVYPWVMVPKH
jgi:hypothetical protein